MAGGKGKAWSRWGVAGTFPSPEGIGCLLVGGVRAVCDFRVVEEFEEWLVVEKPAPLAVHPANGKVEPTLWDGLREWLRYEVETGGSVAILTRLDRETSGLVLVAKTRLAAREWSQKLERRELKKEYEALVRGWPVWDECEIDGRIGRLGERQESVVWLRQGVVEWGRECRTRVRVVERFERGGRAYAWVRCWPETGRMHQIRVHLESVGHALVGDKLYGTDGGPYLEQMEGPLSEATRGALGLWRHALHASALEAEWGGCRHRWESPMSPEMARFLRGEDLGPGLW